MRHRVAGFKLGRTSSHRRALYRNLANALIEHERIVTTLTKAKAVKPHVEKLVTLSKEASQAHRRRAFAELRRSESVEKLFDVLGPRFKTRAGGYCRILHLNTPRLGDKGPRALLEFVERTPRGEPEAGGTEAAAAEPKATAAKSAVTKKEAKKADGKKTAAAG
jgi:large subunit ribosomal protein L17